MKQKIKRLLCVMLSVLMLTGSIPATVFAMTADDFEYNIVSTSEKETLIELTSYNGYSSNVVVPSELDGCRVVGLNGTFDGMSWLKSVVVSEGIENIDNYCFADFIGSVSLPSSLKNIGEGAFQNAYLIGFSLPEGLVSIASGAFDATGFNNDYLVLPDSLEYISEMSFRDSSISAIHIGPKLQIAEVGYYSYGVGSNCIVDSLSHYSSMLACSELTMLDVDDNNPYFKAIDNVLYSKDMQYLVYHCAVNGQKDFIIPDGIKYIMPYSCSNIAFSTLSIGKNVEEIMSNAFESAYIEHLDFSNADSLKKIDELAFYDCYGNYEELIFPKSLESIGYKAFYSNEITAVSFELPSQCKEIGDNAFNNCSELESAFIPASVTTISAPREDFLSSSGQVFYNCNKLDSIIFEDYSALSSINFNMFPNNERLTIDFGEHNSITQLLGTYPKNLKAVDFSQLKNLSSICGSFFKGCTNLESVDLSATALTEISNSCFYGCTNLKEVRLPSTVDTIAYEAFRKCSSLESINLENVFLVSTNAFNGTNIDVSGISASEQKYGDFKYFEAMQYIAISGYTGTDKNIVIPDEINGKPVEVIAKKAFEKKSLTGVTLPATLKRIGDYAFSGNKLLSDTLVIPEGVTIIGERAFENCSSLSEVILPSTLVELRAFAFYYVGCEHITIPDSVVSIGMNALYSDKIKSIDFGSGVKDIKAITENLNYLENINVNADNPYYSSTNGVLYSKDMTTLICYPNGKKEEVFYFAEKLETISDNLFANCIYLKKPVFPSTLKTIGCQAYNASIEELSIPASVTELSDYAFVSCSNLKSVHFEDGFCADNLSYTFSCCKMLENVTFGNDVRIDVLSYTFEETAIKAIDLNCDVRVIMGAFINTPLEDIMLFEGLEAIIYAFANTKLEKIVIPDSVKMLGEATFEECTMLCDVDLGKVKTIDGYAFHNCVSLLSIDLTGVEIISPEAFTGCTNLTKLYFVANEDETYISENEFQGNETVETIVVGNSVTEIQAYAFADCVNLETALIASSVVEIAETAFINCGNLSIVCEPDSFAEKYAEDNSIPYTTFVVAPIPDQKYTGCEITPELDVSAQNRALSPNNDYTAVYTNNINVGTARVNVIGLNDYSIFACLARFNIVKSDVSADKGDTLQSKPTVTDNIENQQSSDDYAKPTVSESNVASVNSSDSNNRTEKASSKPNEKAEGTVLDDESIESADNEFENPDITADAPDTIVADEQSNEKENIFIRLWHAFISFFERIIKFIKSIFN